MSPVYRAPISGGPPTSGVDYYLHVQATPANPWVIVHGLGFEPNVVVIDSAGDEVVGNIHHDSANQVTITFSGAFSGRATLS